MKKLTFAFMSGCLSMGVGSSLYAESNPTQNVLNEKFERWESGSAEFEAQMVEVLKVAFKQVQQSAATDGKLHRGTHAKGTCALGSFEVYELEDAKLRVGLFKDPGLSPVKVRFANGSGAIQPDTTPDARSLSVAVFSKYGRQDFSMNNDPVFPIPTLSDFVLQVTFPQIKAKFAAQVAAEGLQGEVAEREVMKRLAAYYAPSNGLARLERIKQLGIRLSNKQIYSYESQEYWTGTALNFGKDQAVKFKFSPCNKEVIFQTPPDASDDYLQDGIKNAQADLCFEVYVQFLDAGVMRTPEGKVLEPHEWVEDAGLDWDEAGAPYHAEPLAKLTIFHDTVLEANDCDHPGNAFNINEYSLPEHKALGGINRGRTRVEQMSRENRS